MVRFPKIKFFVNFKDEYLSTQSRKIEFLVCIVLSIAMTFFRAFTSKEVVAYVGQIQGFVSVYLAFRFGITGIVISLIFSIKDLVLLNIVYFHTYKNEHLIGMCFVIFTVSMVLIIGSISLKQEKQRREMKRLAITDELTGVFNQRHFHSILETEIRQSAKSNNSIGLILVDVDNFRMYNDLYGHYFGDTILVNTALILKKIVGAECPIYRFEGDEFAILVKNKGLQSLELMAKNIYDNYLKLKDEYYTDSISSKITFSIGLSEYPKISNSKEELVSHANMALYQAKNMGEDKVSFYQDIMLQVGKNMKSDQQQMVGVFKGLLSTIVAKDKYTFGHCERVSSYAVMIGEAMGLGFKEIQSLLHAGLLHDIGKIELPKSVLNKIGRLSEDELALIRLHPIHSAIILEPLSVIDANIIDYVRHHHERYDGKGYPDGIKGEEISLGARILCVADSFDAMVSDRPYRKSMTIEEAFKELELHSGSQFDPKITRVFINLMRNKMSIKYNYTVKTKGIFEEQPV
jgi:diguanylate cyclase (GGDEF)-like protein